MKMKTFLYREKTWKNKRRQIWDVFSINYYYDGDDYYDDYDETDYVDSKNSENISKRSAPEPEFQPKAKTKKEGYK